MMINMLSLLALVVSSSALCVLPPPDTVGPHDNAKVDLKTAGDFAILSKSGISTVPNSDITGDIGVSPIAATAMTGFSLTASADGTYSTSDQVTGKCYAADYNAPTPAKMTAAISDGEAAYTDAAGRDTSSPSSEYFNKNSGHITGATFKEGVYEWTTDVSFTGDIYIEGTADDVFIFKLASILYVGSGAKVVLVAPSGSGLPGVGTVPGPPKAENIFWQIGSNIDGGTTSHLEGIFLAKTMAAFKTGSSLNGRVFAQTAVTLDMATITEPEE